jgi:cell division septum initiation protein DivIVA
MTNAEINARRRLNRVYEQIEKDELVEIIIESYGKALFTIAELKQEIETLKKLLERRYKQ